MKNRPSTLYLFVGEKIRELIAERRFGTNNKIPSENELARMFGVSRMTLREALRALEEEGIITKKHGVGTFIKTNHKMIKSILDVNYSVTEMIQNMGFKPGTEEKKIEEVFPDSRIAKVLSIKDGTKVIAIERVRTADGVPVVFTLDIMPTSLVPEKLININDIKESIYSFIEDHCHIPVSSSLARIFPTAATRKLANRLKIKVNSPLLLLEQTDTDQMGRPILYSREYFITDYFDFVIYRKRKK